MEDDEDINALVAFTLRNAGFAVQSFYETSAIMKCVSTEKPVAIVLDVMLPGGTGFELLRELSLVDKNRSIAKIMLSARCSIKDKTTAFDLGADEYITKPFLLKDLVGGVNKALLARNTEERVEAVVRSIESA